MLQHHISTFLMCSSFQLCTTKIKIIAVVLGQWSWQLQLSLSSLIIITIFNKDKLHENSQKYTGDDAHRDIIAVTTKPQLHLLSHYKQFQVNGQQSICLLDRSRAAEASLDARMHSVPHSQTRAHQKYYQAELAVPGPVYSATVHSDPA